MELREQIAIKSGLSFQKELIRQSKIPLTGATQRLREDIEAIDSLAWEAICYYVAEQNIKIFNKWLEEQDARKVKMLSFKHDDWEAEPLRLEVKSEKQFKAKWVK